MPANVSATLQATNLQAQVQRCRRPGARSPEVSQVFAKALAVVCVRSRGEQCYRISCLQKRTGDVMRVAGRARVAPARVANVFLS